MKYNKVGNSGLKVSEISLGSYLTFGERLGEKESEKIIHKAFELGINSFDTANVYQNGEAERILGMALKPFQRDEYVIATKAYWPVGNGQNSRGLSRKHIIEQVNRSLKRMDIDYLDIFYCHSFDWETPVEETLRAIDDMIRQGKILYAGVSNWSASQIEEALKICDTYLQNRLIVNQCEYSLLKREIEEEIIPLSDKLGISQIVFSPLAQGILTGKYQGSLPEGSRAKNPNVNKFFKNLFTPESIEYVEKVKKAAEKFDVTLPELAIRWVLQQKNVASALMGASTIAQLEENVRAASKPVPDELFNEVRQISVI